MLVCQKCRSPQAEGTNFCTDCGTRLEPTSGPQPDVAGGRPPPDVIGTAGGGAGPGPSAVPAPPQASWRRPKVVAGLAVAVLVVVVGSVVAWQQQESDLQAWGLPAADVATAIGAQGFEPYTDPTGVHDAGHAVLDGRAVDVATFEDEQQQAALLDALADSYATHWPLGHAQHFAAGEGWAVLANYDEDTDPDAAYEAQETLLAQVRDAIGGRQDTVDGALLDPTGRWEGAVLGDASDYDVVVDLGFDPSSGVDGRVQYPALDCSGTWTLQAGTEDSLTLTEQIDQGLERCEEQSEVLVEQESADDLRITFVGSDITARLRRSAQ